MNIKKQDRHGVRTASDLERKYNFTRMEQAAGIAEEAMTIAKEAGAKAEAVRGIASEAVTKATGAESLAASAMTAAEEAAEGASDAYTKAEEALESASSTAQMVVSPEFKSDMADYVISVLPRYNGEVELL